jgi:Glutamine amidotransferase domain
MCGLFGFARSARAAHPELASGVFVDLGRLAEQRGRDAAGFALLGGPPPLPPAVVKDTRPFGSLWRSHHAPLLHQARVALGHTRHASQGTPDRLANAHPLEAGGLIGTVNGDIDQGDLRRRLPPGLPPTQGRDRQRGPAACPGPRTGQPGGHLPGTGRRARRIRPRLPRPGPAWPGLSGPRRALPAGDRPGHPEPPVLGLVPHLVPPSGRAGQWRAGFPGPAGRGGDRAGHRHRRGPHGRR